MKLPGPFGNTDVEPDKDATRADIVAIEEAALEKVERMRARSQRLAQRSIWDGIRRSPRGASVHPGGQRKPVVSIREAVRLERQAQAIERLVAGMREGEFDPARVEKTVAVMA